MTFCLALGVSIKEHYIIIWKTEGMYLHHFTPGKPAGKEQPDLKSAHNIYNWLKDHVAAATL